MGAVQPLVTAKRLPKGFSVRRRHWPVSPSRASQSVDRSSAEQQAIRIATPLPPPLSYQKTVGQTSEATLWQTLPNPIGLVEWQMRANPGGFRGRFFFQFCDVSRRHPGRSDHEKSPDDQIEAPTV
jgi:hypothetical protein